MLKLVDKPDLGSGAERRMGSIPFARTRGHLHLRMSLFRIRNPIKSHLRPEKRAYIWPSSVPCNISLTPLNCALNAFTLALNYSADTFYPHCLSDFRPKLVQAILIFASKMPILPPLVLESLKTRPSGAWLKTAPAGPEYHL